MRRCVWPALFATSVASADDTSSIRVRRLSEAQTEPMLHLDLVTPNPADAEGGIMDSRGVLLDLGPRARFAAQGQWWQSGLAPSMFAEDLQVHGWRASAELSYDLGPFRVGVNASLARVGTSSHKTAGLFVARTFKLSRWMHAWIVLGVGYEESDGVGEPGPRKGLNAGLTLGTTFR